MNGVRLQSLRMAEYGLSVSDSEHCGVPRLTHLDHNGVRS